MLNTQRRPVMSREPARQRGVSLVEAMIAILIFAFGVLALVGLQASATSATTKSRFRIDAGLLASQCIAELWLLDRNNFAGVTCAACNGSTAAADALPNGRCSVAVNGNPGDDGGATAVVTVTWTAPGNDDSTYTAVTRISANPPPP